MNLSIQDPLGGLVAGRRQSKRVIGARRRGRNSIAPRRLALESLEDRRLLAVGDLLYSIPAPAEGHAAFGSAVAADGDYAVVGMSYGTVASGQRAGKVCVFNTSSGDLVRVIDNPNPDMGDGFGWSVAISGTTVVVGAPLESSAGYRTGRAYVYDLSSGALKETLAIPSLNEEAWFATSVAVSGDTVVVGSPFADDGAPWCGAAFVFDAASGLLLHTLHNPVPDDFDRFGASVAISDSTVGVGAPGETTGTPYTRIGAAYVFDAGTGLLQRTLSSPSTTDDQFGSAVAVSAGHVLVGAPAADAAMIDNSGSAYLFDAANGGLLRTLNCPTPASGDLFGSAVALDGDRLLVGAPGSAFVSPGGAPSGGPRGWSSAGSVCLFDATTGVALHTFTGSAPELGDYFGSTVALGNGQCLIGAPGDSVGVALEAGSASLFALAGDLLQDWDSTVVTLGHRYGSKVALSDRRMVVGAAESGGTTGPVRVHDSVSGALLWELSDPAPNSDNGFGAAVAVSGSTVVVGALGDDTAGINTGSVYVYWVPYGDMHQTLHAPASATGFAFGASVAIDGNTIVVGAPGMTVDGIGGGAVFLYDATSGTYLRTLHNPAPFSAIDAFGAAVAISGDTIIVGAPGEDPAQLGRGTAFLFSASTGELRHTLAYPGTAYSADFGAAVAIWNDKAVVGAPGSAQAFTFDVARGMPQNTLTAQVDSPIAHFGHTVAIWKNEVVVGGWAYLDLRSAATSMDNSPVDPSGVCLFDATTGARRYTWLTPTPDPNYFSAFGDAVAIWGDHVAIGDPSYPDEQIGRGAVYVYATTSPDELYVNFGAAGLWAWKNDSAWQMLHHLSPLTTTTGDLDGNRQSDLIADFGPGLGLWACLNDSQWVWLHSYTVLAMVAGDLDGDGHDELVVDFGGQDGTWCLDFARGVWRRLGGTVETMAIADLDGDGRAELVVDPGAGGIYVWRDNSRWSALHSYNPAALMVGDFDGNGRDDLAVDFGAGVGLWAYMNDAQWKFLHTYATSNMTAADLNGDGRDELVVDFGAVDGTWRLDVAATAWQKLGGTVEEVTGADLNGDGRDELIVDTGSGGIYVWRDGAWHYLHGNNPAAVSTPRTGRTDHSPANRGAALQDLALTALLQHDDALVSLDAADGLDATVFKVTAAIGRGLKRVV